MSLLDVPPSRWETLAAYGAAVLCTLVWVGCVVPGTVLPGADPSGDAATAMARGAILILPALVLFVAGSVGTTLASHRRALRGALAMGDAFVALYMAAAVWWTRVRDPGLTALVGVLTVVGLLSVRDSIAALRAAPGSDVRKQADVRLAIALLVLATPPSLLAEPGRERASLLAPFVYIALSAAGARLSRTLVALRFTGSLLMALLAAHLVVAIRYALDDGMEGPAGLGLTWAGHATVALAVGTLVLAVARAALLLPALLARAGEPPPQSPPALPPEPPRPAPVAP